MKIEEFGGGYMNLKEFVEKQNTLLEPIEKKSHLAWWNLATTGKEDHAKQLKEAQIAMREHFSSPEEYQFLLKQKQEGQENDPLINRQSLLLLNSYTENQIPREMIEKIVALETEIESIYTSFRPVIDGKPTSVNELKEIFTKSDDSKKREKAWNASKLIGEEVEEKVKTLIKLRNECAKKVGFSNFYTMRLTIQELDETRLFELVDQLQKATDPLWKKYKKSLDVQLSQRFGISEKDLMPWHYQDPFFQEAPQQDYKLDQFYEKRDIVKISEDFFKSIELPVDDILKKSDLFEREGKSQHAFCTCIDRNQDVRILCNVRDSEYWMATQLHELGHGVYDKFINAKLPFLLRTYSHISLTESIAMLFGRFSKNGQFLKEYCDIDAETAKQVDEKGKQQTSAALLVFARWAMVMIQFERAMYQNKNKDLNKLWWDLVERYQGVNKVPNRNKPDWASKLHLACAPVYYQNYLLGEMIASQLFHYINKYLPSKQRCFSPEAGLWLKNGLFNYGAQYPWEQTVRKVTNEDLNPEYLVKDMQ
jgi:peptidyl-dipeptidase A